MATVVALLIIFVKVYIVTAVLFSLPMPLTWIERKVAAHIQVRRGPMRVGPHGILQPLADTIKTMLKEDTVPERGDRVLFILAPIIVLVPAVMVYAAIPFGDTIKLPILGEMTLYISDMNVALLYVLAISGLGVYGIIFGGWASNSKYAVLGGLRSAAQMISYEIALSFAAIGIVMMANSLSLVEIVRAQSGGFWHWNIFYLPVGPVWFVIFIIAGIAEMNRIPFDLCEDEGSLGAGFHVEYSGMKFAFFMLAEYIAMVTVGILAVLMFFGGWNTPFPGEPILPSIVWFGVKCFAFIYFFMWVRFTLPRYRYDQLMSIGWKILIPLSMVTLLVTGAMRIYL